MFSVSGGVCMGAGMMRGGGARGNPNWVRGRVAAMSVRELADLTWEEVRDLDHARAVAILPVGAVEAHGPHLPLGTDVVIARAMARAGAGHLAALGFEAV